MQNMLLNRNTAIKTFPRCETISTTPNKQTKVIKINYILHVIHTLTDYSGATFKNK